MTALLAKRRGKFGRTAAVVVAALSLAVPASAEDQNTLYLELDDDGRYLPSIDHRGTGIALADIDSITAPALSPNGNRVAFSGLTGDESLGQYGLFIVDTTGSNLTQLTGGSFGEFDPVWVEDGETIIASQNNAGSLSANCCRLVRVDVDSGSITPITLNVGAIRPAAAAGGAFVFFDNTSGVWRMPTVGGHATILAAGGYDATVEPDESTIAYLVKSGSSFQLRRVASGGGTSHVLYSTSNELENPVWYNDRVYFVEYTGTGYDGRKSIFLKSVPVQGGTVRLERTFTNHVVGVTPGKNGDEILFYRDDGLFRYYDIRPDATLPSPISSGSNYTNNWSSITSIDLDGNGEDEMFFYRDDGLWRYYDIRSNGSIPGPSSAGDNYTKNWDATVALDLDGDGFDEMFFYRDDGLYRYYDIRPDGTIPKPMRAGSDYEQNWTSIVALDLDGDGQDEMFFYRQDGNYRYYNVDSTGNLGSPIRSGNDYDTGFTWISAIDLDGDSREELLFYRSDGSYVYQDVGETGLLGGVIRSGDEYTSGWSIITSVKLGPR